MLHRPRLTLVGCLPVLVGVSHCFTIHAGPSSMALPSCVWAEPSCLFGLQCNWQLSATLESARSWRQKYSQVFPYYPAHLWWSFPNMFLLPCELCFSKPRWGEQPLCSLGDKVGVGKQFATLHPEHWISSSTLHEEFLESQLWFLAIFESRFRGVVEHII